MARATRKWIQHKGKLIEVDPQRKARKPVAPMIMMDSMNPHLNLYTNQMVDSKTTHKRILRENGLIELGNEYDAFKREAHNPDFTDSGELVWRDEKSEASKQVYDENTKWIEKTLK